MPRRVAADPELPSLFTTAQALRAGLTAGQVRHRVRSGRWVSVARGLYRRSNEAGPTLDDHAAARLDHVQRAVAALKRNPGCVIGGHSAALLHGLPLFEKPPSEVCLLVPPGHWSGRRSGVVFRKSGDRLGISPTRPATDVARTWLDIARHHSLADALSVGDAALRGGLLTLEVAEEWAAASTSRRGSRRVPIALQHLNSLRETPLESGSWAYFVAHGLPLPDMQVEYRGVGGQFIGRVDFAWRRHDVVGECDGRLKYTDRDVLYAEKRREDELRALGLTVVRWGMGDLRSDRLAARLRAQLR